MKNFKIVEKKFFFYKNFFSINLRISRNFFYIFVITLVKYTLGTVI